MRRTLATIALACAALTACSTSHNDTTLRTAFVFHAGIYDPVVVCPTTSPVEHDGDLVTVHCGDRGDVTTGGNIVVVDGPATWDADLARITPAPAE